MVSSGQEQRQRYLNQQQQHESKPLLTEDATNGSTRTLTSLFERPTPDAQIRPHRKSSNSFDSFYHYNNWSSVPSSLWSSLCGCCCHNHTPQLSLHALLPTVTGSVIFLIYHVVFLMAQASTLLRPHATHSSTGLTAQTAGLGVLTAAPLMIYQLSDRVPAVYPATDLFLAPFLAQLAQKVDAVLFEKDLQNDDALFFGTFLLLHAAGLVLSGSMCVAAARFKWANLGSFLPYSVLCGFFTTIGMLMWTLGFSVDTGGTVGALFHGDLSMQKAALHHAPSLVLGVGMHVAARHHSLWVLGIILLTVLASYGILGVTGISLSQAQEADWFFSPADLVVARPSDTNTTTTSYGPPLPFGVWASLWRGEIVWEAFWAGTPTVLALAFLYVIRCSLHGAAVKKSIPLLTRKPSPQQQQPFDDSQTLNTPSDHTTTSSSTLTRPKRRIAATLPYILEHGYAYSQLAAALVGGIAVAPSTSASLTLFSLGAEQAAPQYGSCLLLVPLYITDFQWVQYIPKPAFSSLMVLAAMDMCRTWIVGSYYKTQDKWEWCVAPGLVVLAFCVGLLNAIFLGIACSTFLFVGNFYKAGTVKFVGSGLTLGSTVERGIREAQWLVQNADLIQILVLQNYIFFGNGQSVLTYISTMFEEEEDAADGVVLLPEPKYLIVDFALVTGMDTSATDLFREAIELCEERGCKLFLAGLNRNIKSMMLYAGLKPTAAGGSRQRHGTRFSYISDLETALAKAEDGLLSRVFHLEELDEEESKTRRRKRESEGDDSDGFLYALQKIDEQHGLNVFTDLADLQPFTTALELQPGEVLRHTDSGIFFVETGLMRVKHSTAASPTLTTPMGNPPRLAIAENENYDPSHSLGHLHARSGSLGRETARLKKEAVAQQQQSHELVTEQSFRLARVGQGWIIGSIETSNGLRQTGIHVAISACRLHHLTRDAMREVEARNPKLSMNLYKLLSHLATKRQEVTIHQLAQFVRIMNAPVPRLRGGRSHLAKLHQEQHDPV